MTVGELIGLLSDHDETKELVLEVRVQPNQYPVKAFYPRTKWLYVEGPDAVNEDHETGRIVITASKEAG